MDLTATVPVPIRCPCPPKDGGVRHPDGDSVHVRSQYGYGDTLALSKASVKYKIGVNPADKSPVVLPYTDAFEQEEVMLAMSIKRWTLVNDKGKPHPVDLATILALPPDVGEHLSSTINDLWEASRKPVPNESSGRSPESSPATSPASAPRRERRARSKKP